MKKLMILAAVAAVSIGAFADNCTPTAVTNDTAWIYNWKFSGKTTIGAKATTKTSGSSCTPGSSTNACIRVPGSVSISGYTYNCDPTCTDFKDIDGTQGAFKATKPQKSAVTPTIAFALVNVIGKTQKQCEAEGTFTGVLSDLENETFTLTFAGLGTFDSKNLRYTSISGNFAGTVDSTYYVANNTCCATIVWACDALETAVEGVQSVAYGTWSVKYNSSASKKYAKNGTLPTNY